ncbi:MAG: transposase [Candidatus Wolfebacteria bacterium]|nr:transposase [Candidatus Wolfebacteria bacterium]
MQKPTFLNNQVYHIYNRGVDKRIVFLDDQDHFRFIHNLFEFNDETPALNIYYKLPAIQSYEVQLRKIDKDRIKDERQPRKLIVEILAFSLMPNHFHLLLRQKSDGGIVKFMQKLGTGYTNYFNKRYERAGSLFQGRFKAILIKDDAHLIHLPYYIHLNPLDLKFSKWRTEGIRNYAAAMEFLESYRWSSFLDYIGKKNFPSLTQREFLNDFFEGPQNYKKETEKWLKEMDFEEIKEVSLE